MITVRVPLDCQRADILSDLAAIDMGEVATVVAKGVCTMVYSLHFVKFITFLLTLAITVKIST